MGTGYPLDFLHDVHLFPVLHVLSLSPVSGRDVLGSPEPLSSREQFEKLSPEVRQPFGQQREHHNLHHHAAGTSLHR